MAVRGPLLLGAVVLMTAVGAGASPVVPAPAIGSFLQQPAYCMDDGYRGPTVAYVPQPGDVMLATDKNVFWKLTHDLAGAFEPHNSAIIVARPDGSLAVLEAGANDTLKVHRLDLLPHLKEYADKGPVWIRKRKTPLTPDQCARLAEWSEAVVGKNFALIRLGGQLTPLRHRGPIRTFFIGHPQGHRRNYFCSELVTESCVYAGLIDAHTARPSATYPHDLFFDHSLNPYINHHLPLARDWEPPARWTPTPW